MKRLTYITAFLLQSTIAIAAPQGAWPESARDLPLGRPSWVLVVPAIRTDDGDIRLWDRADDWVRSWVVPRPTPSGIRTVAISGDSEDQKLIGGDQLDDMRVAALGTLARKYGAEAVAVVVRDAEQAIAVAAWREGRHATWSLGTPQSDGDETRMAALTAIDDIFVEAVQDEPYEMLESVAVATVIAERIAPDGAGMEYRIEVASPLAERLASSPSLRISSHGETTTDVIVIDGRPIAEILQELGFNDK